MHRATPEPRPFRARCADWLAEPFAGLSQWWTPTPEALVMLVPAPGRGAVLVPASSVALGRHRGDRDAERRSRWVDQARGHHRRC
jgi:hypothetical protein